MAKILYGVMGEGFGHSSRADTIASLLEDKHDITFAASEKAYGYLTGIGKKVMKINGLGFKVKENRIDILETLWQNLLRAPEGIATMKALLEFINDEKPQAVISDFEPYTAAAALLTRTPLISIDHQNMINRTEIEYPKNLGGDLIATRLVVQNMVKEADTYIITSFFYPKIIKKDTVLVPPLIRKPIMEAEPSDKGHVLVYQSYKGNRQLFDMLSEITGQKFIVYGSGLGRTSVVRRSENLHFKEQSREGFIKDLASCKAVITNGGYTLISEAIHLKKPILSMPVAGQFEQALNAYYLDRLGFGKYYDELDDVKIIGFLHNLEKYKKSLRKFSSDGNKVFVKEFEQVLAALKKRT